MRSQLCAVYLSDYSYNRLISLAQRNRWLPYEVKRAHGLSAFLNALSHFPLVDTRPENIRRRHDEEIKMNHAPTWSYVSQRRSRLLTLNEETIALLFRVAFQVGIIRAEPWAVGGPRRNSPIPSIAFVIEAIGLGWISPKEGVYPIGRSN